jgi:hypothetical protein
MPPRFCGSPRVRPVSTQFFLLFLGCKRPVGPSGPLAPRGLCAPSTCQSLSSLSLSPRCTAYIGERERGSSRQRARNHSHCYSPSESGRYPKLQSSKGKRRRGKQQAVGFASLFASLHSFLSRANSSAFSHHLALFLIESWCAFVPLVVFKRLLVGWAEDREPSAPIPSAAASCSLASGCLSPTSPSSTCSSFEPFLSGPLLLRSLSELWRHGF